MALFVFSSAQFECFVIQKNKNKNTIEKENLF
jgi:hypothetical protein